MAKNVMRLPLTIMYASPIIYRWRADVKIEQKADLEQGTSRPAAADFVGILSQIAEAHSRHSAEDVAGSFPIPP